MRARAQREPETPPRGHESQNGGCLPYNVDKNPKGERRADRQEESVPNTDNLKPFTSDQSHEKAVENGRKGGKASGEAKRRRKAMKEALDELLSRKYVDRNGNEIQGVEAVSAKVFQQAMDGNLKAAQFIRDTIGEMPVQRIETVEIPPETYERVSAILGGEE